MEIFYICAGLYPAHLRVSTQNRIIIFRNFSQSVGRSLQPDGNKLQNFISKEMKKEREREIEREK
jgi:hypothetical protein